jgi:hypothetical protein
MITLDLSQALAGIERLERRLRECVGFMNEAKPLMEHWERIIEDQNRKGVLAGTDKDGDPAPLLVYRLTYAQRRANYAGARPVKLTLAQRLGQRPNLRRGRTAGYGTYAGILDNNNLTSTEYRKLDGPRLAPRRQFSRVITNLATSSWQTDDPNVWVAQGAWVDVVTPKGKKFLHYHFDGDGQAQYDLRGVRPAALNDCREALRRWAKDTIRRLWRAVA